MIENIKITIMIPTYNQSSYIVKCLESALSQTYKNIEVIVSDDSTNDLTKKALLNYIDEDKIKYYHNVPRFGRVQNYYYTLRNYATGDWVLNLDGDDFLYNVKFLEKVVECIKYNKDIVMVFGREMQYTESTNSYEERENSLKKSALLDGNDVFFNKRKLGINFFHLSSVYKREEAIKVDFYNKDCLGADTLSLMKLLVNNKVYFLNEIGGCWRIHGRNDSFSKDISILVENIISVTELSSFLIKKEFNKKIAIDFEESLMLNKLEIYLIQFLKNKQYKLFFCLLKEFKLLKRKLFYKYLLDIKTLIKLISIVIHPRIYNFIKR